MAGLLGPVGRCVYHTLGDGTVVSEKVRAAMATCRVPSWWNERLQALCSPVGVSGTNGSASSTDSSDTFIAGALLGVAGTAAIAIVQELTRRSEDLPLDTGRSGLTTEQRLWQGVPDLVRAESVRSSTAVAHSNPAS
jgi:hypothetical protein